MQTASEITSLLPEKRICDKDCFHSNGYKDCDCETFNQAIDQIAPKRLEVVIDRERLGIALRGFIYDQHLPEAIRAIILAAKQDKELCRIEVVNE